MFPRQSIESRAATFKMRGSPAPPTACPISVTMYAVCGSGMDTPIDLITVMTNERKTPIIMFLPRPYACSTVGKRPMGVSIHSSECVAHQAGVRTREQSHTRAPEPRKKLSVRPRASDPHLNAVEAQQRARYVQHEEKVRYKIDAAWPCSEALPGEVGDGRVGEPAEGRAEAAGAENGCGRA